MLLDSAGKPVPRGRKEGGLSSVFRLQIAEAATKEISARLAAGEAEPTHLKQLALAAYADVLLLSRKARDLTRAAAGIEKWLHDDLEAGQGKGNVVVAVQIVNETPSKPAIIEANGHGNNGHPALPRFEANGVEFRRDGGNGEGS